MPPRSPRCAQAEHIERPFGRNRPGPSPNEWGRKVSGPHARPPYRKSMPRQKSPAVRTSLYRILNAEQLLDGIQEKYLENPNFTITETSVAGRDGLLISGAMTKESVSWHDTIFDVTGIDIDLGNYTAAAALLIRRDGTGAWALTYGMGFQLLDQGRIDGGFGQRIAIRTADSASLNSLTRTTLDYRSRTDRFSIPSGDNLRSFGVGDFGELVTRLVAKAEIPAMTVGSDPLRVRGADSLSVPLGRAPGLLIHDLDTLEETLSKEALPELEILEQLVAVKKPADLMEDLWHSLSVALTDENARLGLSWPHERIDEAGTPSSYKIVGLGRSSVRDGTPTVDTIRDLVTDLDPEERVERLRQARFELFRDAQGDEPISNAIPAIKWISFETSRDNRRYCFNDGNWYLMNQDYANKVQSRTAAIFERDSGFQLPAWSSSTKTEKAYNQLVVERTGGTLFDRRLIHTNMHPRGIELCDVLGVDGSFIHVKKFDSSGPASHLFSQALVSADAFAYDDEAWAQFRELAVNAGRDPSTIPDKLTRVVFGMARSTRPISADDLFSFTQVTLMRHVTALESRGVQVFVVPIDYQAG